MASPSPIERDLVARCLTTQGLLIGSADFVWSTNLATRALETLRRCIDAIGRLVENGMAVYPAWIKAVVTERDPEGEFPFALDEMAEFLVEDARARSYWDATIIDDRFPHRCPHCRVSAAFIGFNLVHCKARCR